MGSFQIGNALFVSILLDNMAKFSHDLSLKNESK